MDSSKRGNVGETKGRGEPNGSQVNQITENFKIYLTSGKNNLNY